LIRALDGFPFTTDGTFTANRRGVLSDWDTPQFSTFKMLYRDSDSRGQDEFYEITTFATSVDNVILIVYIVIWLDERAIASIIRKKARRKSLMKSDEFAHSVSEKIDH
jgi:hypothetical protein